MRAMILAAGLGTRMRPLTDNVPKPLLAVAGRPLLDYQLERLATAGVREVVINHGRLGAQIEAAFGTTNRGMRLCYSPEGDAPLETGGGIRKALPLLGEQPFLVVNADVWTDLDLRPLLSRQPVGAHIVLVPNPPHHPGGDFALHEGRVRTGDGSRHTYGGIGVYHPALFRRLPAGRAPLAPLLREAIDRNEVTGQLHTGGWLDVGTPDRLAELERLLQAGRG